MSSRATAYWQPSRNFIDRFEALHLRLATTWGTGRSRAVWNALGVPHSGGNWVDFKNLPNETREKATQSNTVAECIIAALYADALPDDALRAAWPSERNERIELADMLHAERCRENGRQHYPHPSRPPDAQPATRLSEGGDARWRQIKSDEFDVPADVKSFPAEYIGGRVRVPWWLAAHSAVERTSLINRLDELLKNTPIVVVHGPTGQGKTTLLRQYAQHWLSRGEVVEFDHASALADRSLGEFVGGATRDILLVTDDLGGEVSVFAQDIFRKLRHGGVSIVIACQSRRRFKHIAKLPRGMVREYPLPNPMGHERMAIADRVVTVLGFADAAAKHIRDLFYAALEDYPKGGLWPAMYQATHAEGLAERMQRLVQDIARDEARLNALAAVVFVNAIRDGAPDHPAFTYAGTLVNRKLVNALIDNLDLSSGQSKRANAALSDIHKWFDREVVGDSLEANTSDPLLDLRHPAVSSVLHSDLFDPFEEGAAHFDESKFYVPYALALASPTALRPADRASRAADIICLMHALTRLGRSTKSRKLWLDHFLKHGSKYTGLLDIMADAALSASNCSNRSQARALIWKAAIAARRGETGPAGDYLSRALAVTPSKPSNDVSVNIGLILKNLDMTLLDPRDGMVRDGTYYMSALVSG